MVYRIFAVVVIFLAMCVSDNDHKLDWLDYVVNGGFSMIWAFGFPTWLSKLFDEVDEEFSSDDDGGY